MATGTQTMFAQRRSDEMVLLTLAQTIDTAASPDVQVAFCGAFAKSGKGFDINAELIDELIASVADVKSDIPIDYEHMMFKPGATPEQRKAAGRFAAQSLERRGEGDDAQLWVKSPQWTPTALEYLKKGEYLYPSIAYQPREGDKPARFLNFTLTNMPVLDGVNAIQCSREIALMATEPTAPDDKKTPPVAAAADVPAVDAPAADAESDMAEMKALLDMLGEGLGGLGQKAVIDFLASNAEKIIAINGGSAQMSAAGDVEKIQALNKALEGRVTFLASRIAEIEGDAEKVAKAKAAGDRAEFDAKLDAAIKSCHVHVAERDAAIALFSKDPESARVVFLSRPTTVVPTAPVPPEAKPTADGPVMLSKLDDTHRDIYNSLREHLHLTPERAFQRAMEQQIKAVG